MTASNEARVGNWFLTFTGKQFYPLDPRPEDICIQDIAHALALTCRFGGHSVFHYSVAQHSILVSSKLPQHLKLVGLLHDATEAYLGDMVRPLKLQMPEYQKVEDALWKVIALKFGLPEEIPDEVKFHDNCALITERRDVCTHSDHRWSLQDTHPPYEESICPWDAATAKNDFLYQFKRLTYE